MPILAFHIGPVQFDQPFWLILMPLMCVLAIWMARRSLSGMGTWTRRAALIVRLIVIVLLAGAIAKPHWRKTSEHVAVTAIMDMSRSVPLDLQTQADNYLKASVSKAERNDLIGRVTAAQDAYVQALPGKPGSQPDAQTVGARDGTNLADALRLALAVGSQDAANRVVIMSDGNETSGSLLSMAATARALHVPIDVLPLKYSHDREFIVERLMAPATARMGENASLRILVRSMQKSVGRLNLTVNGQPIDLDPDSTSLGQIIELEPGINPIQVPVALPSAGPQQFEAFVEVISKDEKQRLGIGNADEVDDSVIENNRAMAVTFVTSDGKVLVLTQSEDDAVHLGNVLTEARIDATITTPAQGPQSLIEFGAYDAVILLNTPVFEFSQQQQEDLRAYVHDLGGGLLMIGGPASFGAGGWIGSPLADALPVKLDPPQKKEQPKLALVMIMHACEMPQGNYWGKETARAAINKLTRLDLAGVIECQWSGATDHGWVYPLQAVGDKSGINQAINNMQHGDAQSFVGMVNSAFAALKNASAAQKHCILVSDGDPVPPSDSVLAQFKAAQISISTIIVFPHTWGQQSFDQAKMQRIAQLTGGSFHSVTSGTSPNKLPEIVIRDLIEHRRTLIWEGDPVAPAPTNVPSEPMRGLGSSFPPITGYIVTADREGLSQVTLRGPENDPILAQWQYGLGRALACTTDASTRWSTSWPSWAMFRAFWEQHIRWVMRPSASANVRLVTEDLGGQTRVIIETLDASGERLDFVRWQGRISTPNGGVSIEPRQVGPGRYEAVFDSAKAGAYVMSLRYKAPLPADAGPDDKAIEGSVQAAVTRPFADEFRALEDNTALLRQVATATGGKVLSGNPDNENLWRRDGLTMPVALTPLWFAFALGAMGLFLGDVAIRRVRIDIPAIGQWVVSLFQAGTARTVQQMGSLKEARERARESMRGEQAAKGSGPAAPEAPRAAAAVKFEATADELATARQTGLAAEARVIPTRSEEPKSADGEAGMSRLLKAKQRAQDDMKRDDKNT